MTIESHHLTVSGLRVSVVRKAIKNLHMGIKKMKTKWGSCTTATHRIWLNLELAKKPPECLEYLENLLPWSRMTSRALRAEREVASHHAGSCKTAPCGGPVSQVGQVRTVGAAAQRRYLHGVRSAGQFSCSRLQEKVSTHFAIMACARSGA